LFSGRFAARQGWRTFDVMPDSRFVTIVSRADGDLPVRPVVVQNVAEDLKRLMRAK
jgi:hypothetical protein